jgi:hypothetical protein
MLLPDYCYSYQNDCIKQPQYLPSASIPCKKLTNTNCKSNMKKSNAICTRYILLCVACILHFYSVAQKGRSYLRLKVPVQYAWYKVTVTTGAGNIKGEKKNQSINIGAGIGYEYFLGNKLSLESGIGITTASYKIVRPFDRRFWGDMLRPLRVTYPRYYYSLLQLPLRVNYRLCANKKLQYFVGLANNFNFTFRQWYSDDSRLHKFYFFSDAVELNVRIQLAAGRKLAIAVEPNVQVYNQWQKDLVLSEYGQDVFEKPGNQPHYNKRFFDAAGITLSAAYRF